MEIQTNLKASLTKVTTTSSLRRREGDEDKGGCSYLSKKLPRTKKKHGVLNPDGTFVIGFSNGTHITANYAFDDEGKLMIFNRKPYSPDKEETAFPRRIIDRRLHHFEELDS